MSKQSRCRESFVVDKDKFVEFTLDPPFAPKVRGKKASKREKSVE